jgi:PadR family transcriptional regulator, regulatory protein AphA
MSIRHAILGFLSWKPFTGYELKKLFADALSFHWSGNNNQIYGSLVELHKDGAVSIELQQQEKYPTKKLYTITESGREELRAWLLSEPELPAFRSLAHIQLAWAECLSDEELDGLLSSYERQLSDQAIMCRESMRRSNAEGEGAAPSRSPRERLIWRSIDENQAAFYENELSWTRNLRLRLKEVSRER